VKFEIALGQQVREQRQERQVADEFGEAFAPEHRKRSLRIVHVQLVARQ